MRLVLSAFAQHGIESFELLKFVLHSRAVRVFGRFVGPPRYCFARLDSQQKRAAQVIPDVLEIGPHPLCDEEVAEIRREMGQEAVKAFAAAMRVA